MDVKVKLEMWRTADKVVTVECIEFDEAERIAEFKLEHLHFKYAKITSLEHADVVLCYYVAADRFGDSHIGSDITMHGAIEIARTLALEADKGQTNERI